VVDGKAVGRERGNVTLNPESIDKGLSWQLTLSRSLKLQQGDWIRSKTDVSAVWLQINYTFLCGLYRSNCMQKSSSWECVRCSAGQKIFHVLWNPKFHYHVRKSSLLDPTLCLMNPVHTLKPIYVRYVIWCTTSSFECSLSFRSLD